MQEAPALIVTKPLSIVSLHLPQSGIPTPSPEFLKAQAIPAYLFFSYTSFTASYVSASAVPGKAICPFGNT